MPNASAGFFGKLPGVGDFVQRRLPARFVDVWDRSFELGVDASRRALGDDWKAAYHGSPVWRFLLPAEVCTASAWAGVMGPARDRVGRCFPMVIATALADDDATATRVLHADHWFDALERVHVETQADDSAGVDAFDARVASMPGPLDMPPANAVPAAPDIDWQAASHWRLPLPLQVGIGAWLAELWARLAGMQAGWCLWWTRGSERVPASVLVTQGLPQASAYAGFLDAAHAGAPWQSPAVFGDGASRGQVAETRGRPAFDGDVTQPRRSAEASLALLPDDLSELLAELTPRADAAPVPAIDPQPVATDGVVVLHRRDGALTLVAADDGVRDAHRQAAAAVATTVGELAADDFSAGLQILRARLLSLHPHLRHASAGRPDAAPEDGAVVAARVSGQRAALLRIGAATAWHWRRGTLQPVFAAADEEADRDAALAADVGDLLFSCRATFAPGLGASIAPLCDEVACTVEAGDRLLLVATRELVELAPDVYARALAMPSCDDARARIATAASLGSEPSRWPLAVIEVSP
ncbi:MAG TPA: type VI secretion system-associated protein TagF [Rhodanobacter sp.]